MTVEEMRNIEWYEGYLLGRNSRLMKMLPKDATAKERQAVVGDVWRYAITELLGWTAQEATIYLTAEIVQKLKLDVFIKKGLQKDPDKCFIADDYRVALQYAFPDVITYSFKDETIREYRRMERAKKKW